MTEVAAYLIHITGRVQGVGFRPFVYRLARSYGLAGWVINNTGGVTLKVEGQPSALQDFIRELPLKAPPVSNIRNISKEETSPEDFTDFSICESRDLDEETSEISPDIAVCDACLEDMKSQANRLDYPFINCTHCGPRFSIIVDFPYDREKTTMAPFHMCADCRKEYADILDRRFHAQPVACINCGPEYTLHTPRGKISDFKRIMERAIRLIKDGEVLAVKGTGGYHLMCNALDETAVDRLRKSKRREGKPFAVMYRDVPTLRKFAHVSAAEESSLLSWKRPIVILESLVPLPQSLANSLTTIGAFLPYTPWHHLFFEFSGLDAIVLTSGNLSGEPIIISDDQALRSFSSFASGILSYNREIYNRTDDSVVSIMAGRERVFRRSRGFVPDPVSVSLSVNGILAAGAELSNCFALGKGSGAYLSQYIGDLKNQETLEFYEETIERFCRMFRIKPGIMAADLHPDYLSTRYALSSGMDTIRIQHHHAHIASCMAENGVTDPVIGLAFDGTGLGDDGEIWGSEFLVCDFKKYVRKAHFSRMCMPGGDSAAEAPWRMGVSLLFQIFGDKLTTLDLPFIRGMDPLQIKRIIEAIHKNINVPLTTGAGRLFDAVAAITGICTHSLYHAEAPMRLEAMIKPGIHSFYETERNKGISFLPAIRQICEEITGGIDPGIIATRFHNTVIEASFRQILEISKETGIRSVALSGGTFQNKYLFESLESRLRNNNFVVYSHQSIPCNDSGIALGQLVIAAHTIAARG